MLPPQRPGRSLELRMALADLWHAGLSTLTPLTPLLLLLDSLLVI